MDVFLAPLFLIFSHHATAWLHQIMNRLAQKYIHSGFTFVIKQPLKHIDINSRRPAYHTILSAIIQAIFLDTLKLICRISV